MSKIFFTIKNNALKNQGVIYQIVDPQGLEPRMSVPKTGVLPITPWVFIIWWCKFIKFFNITKCFC